MNLEQFNYLNNNLHIEDVDLVDLASNIETPFYVYSSKTIKDNCKSYLKNLSTNDLVCYAVKANSNLSILSLIKDEGLGFDVVSGGELKHVNCHSGAWSVSSTPPGPWSANRNFGTNRCAYGNARGCCSSPSIWPGGGGHSGSTQGGQCWGDHGNGGLVVVTTWS